MQDPRIEKLASQLIIYSTHLQKGEKVLIEVTDVPDEVSIALIRAARQAGAIPFFKQSSNLIGRELLREACDAQYKLIAKHELAFMQEMDAYIAIRGAHNIAETSDVRAASKQLAMGHMRPVMSHRIKQTKWCVLRWPTSAMAQQAGMSTEAFENFYFETCLFDYAGLSASMEKLKDLMENTDQVHITGPHTDLHFSIKGIPAIVCGGNNNIPDGEVFTAPIKESVEGKIHFNAPTIYRGTPFESIELQFKQGKIVKSSAATAEQSKELEAILDSDEGARFIGEFALGCHPKILKPMRDILFDEKIAGSFHFTPGEAYEEADNGNRSQVHWDMVSIQRPDWGGGEIHFDGQLIRKDGQFIGDDLAPLNQA